LRGIKSVIKLQVYDFTLFPASIKEEQIQLQNSISKTFDKQLRSLLTDDQNKILQIKFKVRIISRRLRKVRKELMRLRQREQDVDEGNLKLTLWVALIIFNMNQYLDNEHIETEDKKEKQKPKYKKIPRRKISKERVKELIKRVGRSKSADRKVTLEKERPKLEKCKAAWTVSQEKILVDWVAPPGLDWEEFRKEAKENKKGIVPDDDSKMPKYAMNVFNLAGSLFNKKLMDRMPFSMSRYVLEEYIKGKEDPQVIVDELVILLKAKQRKDYNDVRKYWAELGEK
jgi:hypothetical protein